MLFNFYFWEILNNGTKSLFFPAVVSDIFHKPKYSELIVKFKAGDQINRSYYLSYYSEWLFSIFNVSGEQYSFFF